MILRPKINSRERILVFGPEGSGKSHAALTIARTMPADSRMYVIDTDYPASYARLLETSFVDVAEKVELNEVSEWADFLETLNKVCANATTDDWVVVDILGRMWQTVQDWYSEEVHGEDLADYFLTVRRKMSAADAADPSKTVFNASDVTDDHRWDVINPQYRKIEKAFRRLQGHLYATAEGEKVNYETGFAKKAGKDEKQLYASLGYKPRGQKQLGHRFSTLLFANRLGSRSWVMTTVKDRGRAEWEEEEWEDFGKSYLMRVAGWRPSSS